MTMISRDGCDLKITEGHSRPAVSGGGRAAGAAAATDDEEVSVEDLQKAIDDAIARGGEQVVYFLHLVILGAARVGKTSLLRSLLRQLHDNGELSTEGMKIVSAAAQIDNDGSWITVDDMPAAMKKLFVTTLTDRTDADEKADGTNSTPTVTGDVPRHVAENTAQRRQTESHSMLPDEMEDVIREIKSERLAEVLRDANNKFALISTWDLAGQTSYQCALPVFVDATAHFIAAFDASQDVTKLVPLDAIDRSRGREEISTLHSVQTHLDAYLSWLDVLPLQELAQEANKSTQQPVLMVGCKVDERDANGLPPQDQVILDTIKSSSYSKVLRSIRLPIIYVNNTKSGKKGVEEDSGVKELRDEINRRCGHESRPIPKLWLRFALAICMLKEKPKMMPWLPYKKALKLALRLDSIVEEESMKALLHYHRRSGHLAVFPKLDHLVLIDQQFVVDAITALLQAEKLEDNPKAPDFGHFKRLKTGFVSATLGLYALQQYFIENDRYRHVVSEPDNVGVLLQILEDMGVLARVPAGDCNEGGDTAATHPALSMFIFPLGVQRKYNVDVDGVAATRRSSYAYIRLNEMDASSPFTFWQCVVECLLEARRSKQDIRDSEVWHNTIRFRLHRSSCNTVCLQYCRMGYRVWLERDEKACSWSESCSDGVNVLSSIASALNTVKLRRALHFTVETSLACPCPKADDSLLCHFHGKSMCKEVDCQHWLQFAKDGEVPRCSSRSEQSQKVDKEARFWLGLYQNTQGDMKLYKVSKPTPAPCSATATGQLSEENSSGEPSSLQQLPTGGVSGSPAWFANSRMPKSKARTPPGDLRRAEAVGKYQTDNDGLENTLEGMKLNKVSKPTPAPCSAVILRTDPWKSAAFKARMPELASKLTSSVIIWRCYSQELIHDDDLESIEAEPIPQKRNWMLLRCLQRGNHDTLKTFCDIVREVEPLANVKEILRELEPLITLDN